MKYVLQLFLTSCIFCGSLFVSAQNFKPPVKYAFSSVADYHKHDSQILRCVSWIERIAPGENIQSIKSAEKYLATWMYGNTYVNYTDLPRMESFFIDCPDYRIYYLAGWAKYALRNQGTANRFSCAYAGMKSVIGAYKRRDAIRNDANVADIVQMEKNGALKAWVQEKLK